MPTTNGREQVFNEGIKNNDSRPADTTADFLVSQNEDGTQGKIDPVNLPISDATQEAIDAVEEMIPTAYTNNVYVNNDDPNSATIFSLDNPPVVNDDSLKNSSSNLYIGLNSSLWVYNGTNYSTKPETSTSNFNFANTPNDAGGNKNLPISRTGSVQAPAFIKTGGLSTEFLKADGSIDNTNYGSTSDYSLYASQQEKYKFYEPEGISENPPILSAPVQNGTSTLPDFVFKSTVSGTALSAFFSYFTGEMKRADYSKATDTYSGTFPDYNYVKNIAVTTTNSFGNVAVEFTFDGLAIELVEKGQNARIQILVDEGDGYKRLTHLTQQASPANGSRYLRKMTFPDRRLRKIKVEYSGGYFGGVYVSAGDNVTPVVRRVGKKAIFFGNSFTEGTGGDGAFNGYAAVTGDLLGLESWMSGSGGTGYINSGPTGRVKFQDRVSRDVVYYTPDIVVIEGGNNDTTQDQTALSTAVNLLISTIKTALPSATIYVLSNFQLQGSTTNIVNTRNTIKAAALANSVFFIDVIDGVSYTAAGVAITQPSGSWITGGGSITDIKLYGNASMYVAADKAHPSIDGHRYIGNRLALEMSRLSGSDFFNTAGTTTPEFPAYATLASPAFTGVPTAPTATAGTNTTQLATTAFVLANATPVPYNSYVANLSQAGTSAPNGTEFQNQLPGTWSYLAEGTYQYTLSSAIDTAKFYCPQHGIMAVILSNGIQYRISVTTSSSTVITLQTRSEDGDTLIDDALTLKAIEFRVYN